MSRRAEDNLTGGMLTDDEKAVPWASQTEKNFDFVAPNLVSRRSLLGSWQQPAPTTAAT